MSAGWTFDIDAIMRDVRAAAYKGRQATTATWLQSSPNRSQVAVVANHTDAEIEERAGVADSVPAAYLDAWARLNCQKPEGVTEADWRPALHDGGLFLDTFGSEAATLGWLPGELFDVRRGLSRSFQQLDAIIHSLFCGLAIAAVNWPKLQRSRLLYSSCAAAVS